MQPKRFCRFPFAGKGAAALFLVSMLLANWVYSVGAAPPSQSPDEGQAIFQQKCVACHTIGGGPLSGPDLQGVTTQRDHDWLIRWITAPDQMLSESDPIATQLLEEFNNLPMPNLAVSEAEAEALLAYLGSPDAASAAAQPTASAITGDAAVGEMLFTGKEGLKNGGPACSSCHNAGYIGVLGGGTLGPDLTRVFDRFGNAGLAASLKGLPYPTMQGVFADHPLTDEEAADLHAYLTRADYTDQIQKNTKTYQPATPETMSSVFLLIGLAGSVLLVALGHFIWRKRLTGVRKPLVGSR